MSFKIEWSPRARMKFLKILEYIEEKWTEKEVEQFIIRTEKVLQYIQENPRQYPYSRKRDFYKAVISKQTSLFYRVSGENLYLITFWDNRRDPGKLKL